MEFWLWDLLMVDGQLRPNLQKIFLFKQIIMLEWFPIHLELKIVKNKIQMEFVRVVFLNIDWILQMNVFWKVVQNYMESVYHVMKILVLLVNMIIHLMSIFKGVFKITVYYKIQVVFYRRINGFNLSIWLLNNIPFLKLHVQLNSFQFWVLIFVLIVFKIVLLVFK